MSIATEITRLQTAKADLKTAIEGKGVTVPSATKIDGYADLVEAIQSGGGGDGVIEAGTFTLESDTKTVTLQHGLGAIPDFCIVYPINTPTATSSYRMNFQVLLIGLGQENYNISTNTYSLVSPHNMGGGTGYNTGVYGQFNQSTPQNGYAGTATTTTIKVGGVNEQGSSGTLIAGEYGYIVGVLS